MHAPTYTHAQTHIHALASGSSLSLSLSHSLLLLTEFSSTAMTAEGEAANAPAAGGANAPEAEGTKESEAPATSAPPVRQTKCILLTGFGGPKYLRVQSKDQRTVGKGEIAIEVEACGVGFQDLMMRQGLLDFLGKPPFVMGSECCGKVAEIGEGVTKFKVGDEVVVLCENGTWTEHLVVRAIPEEPNEAGGEQTETAGNAAPLALVLHKPASLSANQAAVFLLSYLPAYLLLHNVACVRSGDIVLVHSAGGGIVSPQLGTAIGQLAKLIPKVKLIGTASTAKHENLNQYYSQLISSTQDYVSEVKKEHPTGVTVVLDSRSGEDTNKSLSLLQPLGRYIVYGNSSFVTGERKNLFNFAKSWIQMDRINPLKLLEENKSLGGFSLKQMLFRQHHYSVVFEAWRALQQLLAERKIEPIVDSEWSFEEVKEALHKLQDRKNFGKVVISPKLKPKEFSSCRKNWHALSAMQTSISAEEFARFQSQFLELRKQKYTTEEDLSRAEKKVVALENTLAQQSGELAQLQSRLSSIQHAGDIATVIKENQYLRQRLLNVESSFQLQVSTLRAECGRLQAENAQLKKTCSVFSTVEAVVQTLSPSIIVPTTSTACQTFKSGWASAVTQTEATSAEVAEWFAKATEMADLLEVLESERRNSEGLLKEVSRRELDVERLEGECEALRSELNVAERRGERVQRELQRQLASAVRAAKRAASGNAPSLSSLVVVPSTDQNLDGISVESFSFCGGSQTTGNDNGEASEASSTSQTQPQQAQQLQQAFFSEEDLKARNSLPLGLLARLSEVQEENCNLRYKLKHLQLEVDAKSKIIQRALNDKFSSSSPHCANSTTSETHHASAAVTPSSPASTITTTPIRLASDMISTLRSKLKSLEMSSSTAAMNSTELKGLKRLCEELMTRNISLEQALEVAIAGSNGDLEA
ncbi:unnamed protein product [Taenia asiatica]|uniref:PKS_ER domain-containing protein n=1 Tax=Taenia asiatica TaxID=60517 RepID=A0A0R3WBV5_TAEAS|nr:unnamed protein product [Taenia asiatica]